MSSLETEINQAHLDFKKYEKHKRNGKCKLYNDGEITKTAGSGEIILEPILYRNGNEKVFHLSEKTVIGESYVVLSYEQCIYYRNKIKEYIS